VIAARRPPRGWQDLAGRVRDELRDHHSTLTAAGVAFYTFLLLVPALAASVSVYGLIADPDEVETHVGNAFAVLPADARQLLVSELSRIVDKPAGTLGGALTAAVLVAMWSASKGVAHLLDAIGVAYDEKVDRGFVRRRALALAFTLGAIVAGTVVATAFAVLPDQVSGGGIRWVVRTALWVGLALLGFVGLVLMHRYGSDGDEPRWTWAAPGSVLVLVLLVLVTAGLNVYVTHFGSYDATYGALAGVVVLLLWLHLAALIVIVGAHVNADLEREAARDTGSSAVRITARRGGRSRPSR
jgi:membrane protein